MGIRRRAGVWWLFTALCLAVAGAESTRLDAGRDPLAAQPEFLPVDEAFVLRSRLEDDRVVARWTIAAGCYLYRHAFALRIVDRGSAKTGLALAGSIGSLAIPPGQKVVDDYFGEVEVYRDSVEISARLAAPAKAPVTVQIGYQGCAEQGLCYPPQIRTITLGATPAAVAPSRHDCRSLHGKLP